MACFLVPAAEAVIVTAAYIAVKKKEQKIEAPKLADGSKFEADESIKAHAACTEEGQFVDHSIVESLNLAFVYYCYGLFGIEWYAQVACQTIARPAWYDA